MTALLALVLALQQTPAPATPGTSRAAPASPAAAAPKAPPRRPAPRRPPCRCGSPTGRASPVLGLTVTAEGPVSREASPTRAVRCSSAPLAMAPTASARRNETFITLEKEVTVRAGAASAPIELRAVRCAAAPASPTRAGAGAGAGDRIGRADARAGESRVLSIADLAERSLSGRDPIKLVPVACSGLDNTQMVVLRERERLRPMRTWTRCSTWWQARQCCRWRARADHHVRVVRAGPARHAAHPDAAGA